MSSSTVVPDTNDVTVALVAVAWAIIEKVAKDTGIKKPLDAKGCADQFDTIYKQLLKTIQDA